MKLLCGISSLITVENSDWINKCSSQTFGKTNEDFPTFRINQSNTMSALASFRHTVALTKESRKGPKMSPCLVLKQYMVVYQVRLQKEHIFNANEVNYIIILYFFIGSFDIS